MSVVTGILIAAGGSLLTLAIVAAVNALRTRSSLPRRMERIEGVVAHIAEEMSVQTGALKAALEALQGKCNGNVESALETIAHQQQQTASFYQAKALER